MECVVVAWVRDPIASWQSIHGVVGEIRHAILERAHVCGMWSSAAIVTVRGLDPWKRVTPTTVSALRTGIAELVAGGKWYWLESWTSDSSFSFWLLSSSTNATAKPKLKNVYDLALGASSWQQSLPSSWKRARSEVFREMQLVLNRLTLCSVDWTLTGGRASDSSVSYPTSENPSCATIVSALDAASSTDSGGFSSGVANGQCSAFTTHSASQRFGTLSYVPASGGSSRSVSGFRIDVPTERSGYEGFTNVGASGTPYMPILVPNCSLFCPAFGGTPATGIARDWVADLRISTSGAAWPATISAARSYGASAGGLTLSSGTQATATIQRLIQLGSVSWSAGTEIRGLWNVPSAANHYAAAANLCSMYRPDGTVAGTEYVQAGNPSTGYGWSLASLMLVPFVFAKA